MMALFGGYYGAVTPTRVPEGPHERGSARTQGDGAGRSAQRGTSGAATGPRGRSPLPRKTYCAEAPTPETYSAEPSAPEHAIRPVLIRALCRRA